MLNESVFKNIWIYLFPQNLLTQQLYSIQTVCTIFGSNSILTPTSLIHNKDHNQRSQYRFLQSQSQEI